MFCRLEVPGATANAPAASVAKAERNMFVTGEMESEIPILRYDNTMILLRRFEIQLEGEKERRESRHQRMWKCGVGIGRCT
jgi:hypothetical protein